MRSRISLGTPTRVRICAARPSLARALGCSECEREVRWHRSSLPVGDGSYSITMDRRNGNVRSTKFHNLRSNQYSGARQTNVRSWRKSGRHLLMLSVSQFDHPERTLTLAALSRRPGLPAV
jgi:hypothetical protein